MPTRNVYDPPHFRNGAPASDRLAGVNYLVLLASTIVAGSRRGLV